jgi:mannose-6-phosphate isomerase-like protein (cupin superfamily)
MERDKMNETVQKPWGNYTIIDKGKGYQVKRHIVNPGKRLSLQKHKYRCELWVIVSGKALAQNGERKIILNVNDSTFFPQNTLHRFENHGEIPLVAIEVQTGDYLGEDDIERFEDDYGRENTKDI